MSMTRFDKIVASTIVLLLAAIGITVLVGDRVGVQLRRVAPLGEAHSTDTIVMQFTEAMERASVEERLRVEPPVSGEFSWSGDTVLFRPETPLQPGSDYTVSLEPGAVSRSGREVLRTFQFSFDVRQPQVAYLAPADSAPQNIWIADPAASGSAEQITFSDAGVFDYAVSPDGRKIVFSERRTDRPATDLKMLDLDTGAVDVIVRCDDSDCNAPVWRPDGNMLAYTRVDFNSDMANVDVSLPRIWLVDLTTSPPTTQPLFQDSQILGYGAQWSGDGTKLSLYDNSIPGIRIYDFEAEEMSVIPSEHGTTGALSPDGTRIVFPELVLSEGTARARLTLANLATEELQPLSDPTVRLDDDVAVWHPDGEQLAIGRRYWDERYTRGLQMYLMDASTGEAEPLVVDETYAHGFFFWDPTGTQLVMQRFPQLTETGEVYTGGRPEIWTYDMATDELVKVAENGFFPRWVP